jgi:hypothetical protein
MRQSTEENENTRVPWFQIRACAVFAYRYTRSSIPRPSIAASKKVQQQQKSSASAERSTVIFGVSAEIRYKD